MAKPILKTDETLRSQLQYGTPEFPFACFIDDFRQRETTWIEWHWHDEFEFSFVMSGSIICRMGADTVTLHSGDGLFINSGTIHRFESSDGGVLVNFIFSSEFIAEKSSAIYIKYIQPLFYTNSKYLIFHQNDAGSEDIRLRLQELCSTVNSEIFAKELRIRNLLSDLWHIFIEKQVAYIKGSRRGENSTLQTRLQKMITFIHENYHRRVTLDDISSAANISKSEALRCFHEGIETTPVKYLNEYRLNRAADRLLSSSDTILSISESVGFESSGYFCQVFKSRYGTSPNSFRKRRTSS